MVDTQIAALMAMAISYNWLFLWDYIYIYRYSINGVLIVLITSYMIQVLTPSYYDNSNMVYDTCTYNIL